MNKIYQFMNLFLSITGKIKYNFLIFFCKHYCKVIFWTFKFNLSLILFSSLFIFFFYFLTILLCAVFFCIFFYFFFNLRFHPILQFISHFLFHGGHSLSLLLSFLGIFSFLFLAFFDLLGCISATVDWVKEVVILIQLPLKSDKVFIFLLVLLFCRICILFLYMDGFWVR